MGKEKEKYLPNLKIVDGRGGERLPRDELDQIEESFKKAVVNSISHLSWWFLLASYVTNLLTPKVLENIERRNEKINPNVVKLTPENEEQE